MLISPENPPNTALSNFEFAVISFLDRGIASEGARSIFLHAEDFFTKNYPHRSVGWAMLDVISYPDLVPYENENVVYPI